MIPKFTTGLWFDKGQGEERWLKAFEAYGHAMACAAALEMQLSLFLIKKRALDMRDGLAVKMSEQEAKRFAERTRKLTFPKLIGLMRRAFDLSQETIDALEMAKRGRDHLAHDFWQAQIGFIQIGKGVDLIVEECANDVWHFRNVSTRLEDELGFNVDDFTEQTARSAAEKIPDYEALIASFR